MLSTEPHEFSSKPRHSAPTADDYNAAQQRMQNSMKQVDQLLADLGVVDDLATMYEFDSLSAEFSIRDTLFDLGRRVEGKTFEKNDNFESSVEVEGEKYNKVAPSIGHAMTILGLVEFLRARYRPASRKGESFIPIEHQLGLTVGGLTPAAASLSMAFLSNLTARESADAWQRVAGEGPSDSTLVRLSAEAGRCLDECSTEVMDELRNQEELPEDASIVQIGLDGIMMRMNAEKNGDDVIEDARWREASCGAASVLDQDGNKLQGRYFGRLPEHKKESLKTQLRKEWNHLRSQNPDLKLVVTADGAKDNWTFSKSLDPDEKDSTDWFEDKRHILRHEPKGVGKVIDALRHLLRKSRGKAEIQKTLRYYRNNRRRMNYYELAKKGYPIGSGEVEAANKVLVTHRLKRSGQRWGRDGGQGVLSFRALLKSDRFERAWSMVVPRMERSKKQWEPVRTAANIGRQILEAA